ncbi:type II secretion system protein GspK [Botrimarina mediterranea]|uniref:General secretion pathway protein K n=1 Tax=Botrimarina mediterranea TaxID=2528022 RepID=A0A518K754_9BACT|nr:type II secretion system protein GspK [Botrimarina mediterranea]QDV73626.1 General secretion pathway protein K [Botrimarina mediterranea]QDV78216.1 General secretion pathway protein K [Planctomycetes bacterium K2D]
MRYRNRRERRGVLLLVVLVVVALMAIANLSYFDWTFAERKAADASVRREQAYHAAESATEMLRVYLSEDATTIDQDGGWYENPARFRAVLVADHPAAELRVRAAAVAPRWGNYQLEGARFGLEDDSGRLNLNTLLVTETREEGAARTQLMALPGMTEAIADAILDWMDEDDDVRSLGAERDYYSTLEPPILPMNGPISTLEQLLQVKGVTPELLWGLDQDRNYEVSPAEAAGVALPVDNSTGELSGGWASMLTLYSAEANVQPDGTPKINVNGDDLQQLHTQIESVLGIDAANFVVAYRQGGPEEDPDALDDEATEPEQPEEVEALGEGGGEGGGSTQMQEKAAGAITIDFNAPAAEAITDPLDLVGVRVRVVEAGQLEPAIVTSPWQEGDTTINQMVSTLTTTDATSIPGRVNINQAPRAVLIGLPGMPPNVADAIVANRDPTAGSTRPDRLNAVWLLTEGYLQLEEMKALAPYVTGQGAVYRTQVVGGYEAGGPIRRMEVVLDATTLPPRVVLRRDLSPLGAGFDPALTLVPEGAGVPQ